VPLAGLLTLVALAPAPALADSRAEAKRHFRRGMAAIRAGDLAAGVASLERAYEIRPHHAVLYNIARAYLEQGDLERALATFERYLDSDPDDAERVARVVASLRARQAAAAAAAKPPPPVAEETAPPSEPMLGQVVARLEGIEQRLDDLTRLVEGRKKPAAQAEAPAAAVEVPALEDKAGDLYDLVVVSAARRASSPLEAPVATTIVSDEELRLSGAASIPDVLRRVPGMETLTMTAADVNLAIRGFDRRLSNKLLVLVNGRSVYLDFLGATWWHLLSIQLEDIERIEVIRGPGSTLYGANAFGGVVNVITRPPGEPRNELVLAGGSGGALRAAHLTGGRAGPVGWRASVGYEQLERWSREADERRPDLTQGRPDHDLALQVARFDTEARWVPSRDVRVGLSGGLAYGGHHFYALGVFRSFWSEGLLAHGMADATLGPVSVRGFVNHLDVDSRPELHPTGGPTLETHTFADVADLEAVWRDELDLLLPHDLAAGAGYRFKRIDWGYLDARHTEHHAKAFAEDRISLHERLDLTLGVRLDLHPLVGPTPSPRGALVFQPVDGLALRLTGSTAFRTPTFLESYLGLTVPSPVAAVSIYSRGDRDLAPEEVKQLDLGVAWAGWDWLAAEVVAYAQQVEGLIQLGSPAFVGDPRFDSELARRPVSGTFLAGASSFENSDRVYRGGGLELSASLYPADGVDLKASYTLEAMVDTDTGARYLGNPTQKAHAGLQLRSSMGLDLGVDLHYTSPVNIPEREFDTEALDIVEQGCKADRHFLATGRVGWRLLDDRLELAVTGFDALGPLLSDQGHREHCFSNPITTRVMGWMTWRFER